MLIYSINKLLVSKGIKYKINFFQKCGFTYNAARNIASDRMGGVHLKTIEKICVALDCTPNDLLTYVPDHNPVGGDHPLRTLNDDRYKNEIVEGIELLNTTELEAIKEHLRLILEQKKAKGGLI